MGAFDVIFDPEKNLQSLRERLEKAKDGVSDRVYGPIHQAFTNTIQHITQRVEDHAKTLTTGEMVGVGKRKKVVDTKVTTNTTMSVTDAEIRLEVAATAKGIATNEYGDSQNRPTGIVRQEAMSLQADAGQILKDVIGEA